MHPYPESAVDIWRRLATEGASSAYRTVRFRPVDAKEIAKAEARLGIRLPPSYVELVTKLGAPALAARAIPGVDPDQVENLPYAVLTPREIVKYTKELRDSLEPDMLEDPGRFESIQDLLAHAVLFQLGSDAGEGWVFLTNTANREGEMHVADYARDYVEELAWSEASPVVFASLAAATAVVERAILSLERATLEAVIHEKEGELAALRKLSQRAKGAANALKKTR